MVWGAACPPQRGARSLPADDRKGRNCPSSSPRGPSLLFCSLWPHPVCQSLRVHGESPQQSGSPGRPSRVSPGTREAPPGPTCSVLWLGAPARPAPGRPPAPFPCFCASVVRSLVCTPALKPLSLGAKPWEAGLPSSGLSFRIPGDGEYVKGVKGESVPRATQPGTGVQVLVAFRCAETTPGGFLEEVGPEAEGGLAGRGREVRAAGSGVGRQWPEVQRRGFGQVQAPRLVGVGVTAPGGEPVRSPAGQGVSLGWPPVSPWLPRSLLRQSPFPGPSRSLLRVLLP